MDAPSNHAAQDTAAGATLQSTFAAVFDTPELLEMILLAIPPIDIPSASSVPKQWRAAIATSTKLRHNFLAFVAEDQHTRIFPLFPWKPNVKDEWAFHALTSEYGPLYLQRKAGTTVSFFAGGSGSKHLTIVDDRDMVVIPHDFYQGCHKLPYWTVKWPSAGLSITVSFASGNDLLYRYFRDHYSPLTGHKRSWLEISTTSGVERVCQPRKRRGSTMA